MKKLIAIIPILFFVIFAKAQETAKERNSLYIIHLSHLKTQQQIDAVKNKVAQWPNVQSVALSFQDYNLSIKVKEGGEYGNFNLSNLKEFLINQNIEVETIDRKTIQ
ncbi:MAG: hypothetical protein Kow0079_08300 [Vicingaceae bacterium]